MCFDTNIDSGKLQFPHLTGMSEIFLDGKYF